MGEGGEEGLHDIFWWKSNESKYHLYYDGIWNFLRNKKKIFHSLKKIKLFEMKKKKLFENPFKKTYLYFIHFIKW